MRRSAPYSAVPVVLAALLLAVAACTDRNPAGSAKGPQPELPPSTMSMLTCTVSVRAATLACRPQDPGVGSDVSAALIGGQGSYVQLTSTGVHYDSISTFTANVTLENLTAQALGTADGVTPSADGVRVFFSSDPVAAEGSGPVEVANADGEAFFTGAGQKYFRYEGILPPGDTTPAREWRFTVPPSVTRFTFGVYVAAPVRAETGWMSLSPIAPALRVGTTMQMTATARNVAGGEAQAQPVTWTTSNPAVATVDGQGLVQALAVGTATVTAAAGGGTASVGVRVYADSSQPFSTVVGYRALESTVTADGVDSVRFEIRMSGEALPPGMIVRLRSPNGVRLAGCSGSVSFTTSHEGVYRCSTTIPGGWPGGAWRVDSITAGGAHGHGAVSHAGLVAAGAPAHLYVDSPNEDRTAPELFAFEISPTTVRAGVDVVEVLMGASDEQSSVNRVGVIFSSPGNPRFGCMATPMFGFATCRTLLASWNLPGTWTADSVWAQDDNGNRRTLTAAQLEAAGFQPRFTMTSTNPDTIPPTITAFGFSPATVAGNGADSVTVTLSASDRADHSGVWFLDMEFEKETDTTQRRRCLLNGTGRVSSRTMTCRVAFGAADAGTWRVRYVRAIDFMNLSRVLFTADLQAAGYPTALTVTPP